MAQLLQNAVYGTAMILAAAVLRRAMKDRLAPEARLALWAVCLFRLLTPAAPESVLSLWRLFVPEAQSVSPPPDAVFTPAVPAVGEPAAPVAAPEFLPAPAPVEAGFPWEMFLSGLWLAAGVGLGLWFVRSYLRTRRAVDCAAPVGRDDPRYASLPRYVRLREGPVDGAPLTFGAVRPTVVLTPGLSGTELECVLAHEGVHARRRDNLWHYVTAAALAAHWWNPAVWLMARLLRRDIELACDRAAVKRLGAERRAEYANALVSLATKAEGPAFCQTFGRKSAEERIIAIMKYKKTTVAGAALTLALVLAVTVGFASNPAERLPDEESTTSSAPAPMLYTFSFSPEGELLKIRLSLDCLRDSLAEHVADGSMTQALAEHMADGSMTQEEADGIMERAEALSQDGVMLEWTFTGPSGLFTHRDSHQEGFDVYYLDGDGHEVSVDPAGVVERFILPDSIVKALSQYADGVEPTPVVQPTESGLVPAIGTKGEEGYIRQSDLDGPGGQVKNPEEALAYMEWLETQPAERLIPLYDEQGNVIGQFAVSNSKHGIGYVEYHGRVYNRAGLSPETLEWLDWYLALTEEEQLAVSYEPAELRGQDGTAVTDAGPMPMTLEEYEGMLEDLVSGGQMTREDADWFQAGAAKGMEGQTTPYLWATADGSYAIRGGNICTLADCGNTERHTHDGVWYTDWVDQYTELPVCTAAGCAVSGTHYHENGEVIHYYDTLPAKIPVCPVEGCAISGLHVHGGSAVYACNGAHSGGVCDGGCNPWSVSPSASGTGGHHGESHHSGHH